MLSEKLEECEELRETKKLMKEKYEIALKDEKEKVEKLEAKLVNQKSAHDTNIAEKDKEIKKSPSKQFRDSQDALVAENKRLKEEKEALEERIRKLGGNQKF